MADFSITGEVRLNSDPAEKSIDQWTVASGALIADFAKKAASALESVVKSGVTYNAGMESYLTNFKVMLGDEQLAAEKLEEIRKMAASTPFALSDLTDGTQMLLQFGIAANDTTAVLQQLGDISLGNADKLQTLVRAYGKMSSAQKVTLENVNMMIDAGFNPLNQICDATGESMSDLYKRISDGKVGFEELQAAVAAATSEGGQFYNGMLEASQTVNGRLSTLQDNVSALIGKLTDGLFSAFGDIIGKANELVVAFLDDDEKMAALKETIGLTATVVASAGAAFLAYKGYIALTTAAAAAQTAATAAMTAAHTAAANGANGLAVAQAALNTVMKANPIGLVVSVVAALATALVTAYNTSETFRNVVNSAFQAVANAAKSAIGEAISWLDQLSYKLNKALGKDAYSGYGSYNDYKADKNAQKAAEVSAANRANRRQAALAGSGISTKSWTERQEEANAAAKAAQQAEQTISAAAGKAAASTQKAGSTTSKAAAEVVNSVTSTATAVKDVVATTKDTQTALVNGVKTTTESTTKTLADGSEEVEQIITATGTEVIAGVERTVKTVTTIAADGARTVAKTIEDAGPQYASAGEMLTTQLRTKLDDGWKGIQSDIQTDALGAVETLAKALKNGDLEQLGRWAASYFWQACTKEQQAQITSLAMGALNQLTDTLGGVGSNLASLATSLVAKFVPAAATATAGQTALNVAMDANPILLVISLIGMLVGALLNLAGTNKTVGEGFKKVWYGVEDVLSVIFEGILRVIGLTVQGFVSAVNAIIDTYNFVAQGLGLGTISRVSNPLWKAADKIADQRKKRQEERNGAGSADKTPAADDADKKHTDAIEDNTEALLTANKKLAEMVKQADSLVLSDNMAVTRSVAASGTAQVAAAARQYTRQGDTNITQNIYSKAQTAADLQREARWEADRARAVSR